MTDPLLTDANPGGTNLTIASFSNNGKSNVITIKLLHSLDTSKFFQRPTSAVGPLIVQDPVQTYLNSMVDYSNAPSITASVSDSSNYSLQVSTKQQWLQEKYTEALAFAANNPVSNIGDNTALLTYEGCEWTQTEVSVYSDYGSTFVGLARAYLEALTAQNRVTQLTATNLFQWLSQVWLGVRSYFINNITNGIPFQISILCPSPGPAPLVVQYSDALSLVIPATIPKLQIAGPLDIPFSSIPESAAPALTQAFATINYPTPGTEVISGNPIMLIADPGSQAATTHKFTWYFLNSPALSGPQVSAVFTNTTDNPINIPVTLLVTNILTGLSAATVSYVIVEP